MTPDVGWDRGGSPRHVRWALLTAMLLAVVAVGALLGRGIPGGDPTSLRVEEGERVADGVRTATGGDDPVVMAPLPDDLDPGDLVPGRWETVASGPLSGRSLASMTWTGEEAIIWGGLGSEPHDDGAAFDPAVGAWTLLPESPLSPRFAHAAAWTGNEVVIAGGSSAQTADDTTVAQLSDAAAFNTSTRRWRKLPALPFPVKAGGLFAGHGRLFAVAAAHRPRWIAMLEEGDPGWTHLPVTVPGASGALGVVHAGRVDDELVVWNRHGVGAGVAVDITGDPTDAEQWRPLRRAPTPLSNIGTCCELVAGEVDGAVDVIAYDRSRAIWRPLAEATDAQLAVSPDVVVMLRLSGSSAVVDRRTGTLVRLPAAPIATRRGAAATWAGDRLLLWGGADAQTGRRAADGAGFVVRAP